MATNDPTPGSTKAVAAVLAGSVVTIAVWATHQFGGVEIPDYVQGAITTVISTAAVFLAPHQIGNAN